MALLFYRDNPESGEKEGAAGTKAIYLSDEKALRYFNGIYDGFDEDAKDAGIANAVKAVYDTKTRRGADGNDPFEAINEERHHFKIVRTSAAGRLFYLWNPLLRTAFTAYHHRVENWSNIQPVTIHDEVRRHFLAYVEFYHCAAPIVEAAYDIENEAKKEKSGGLEPSRDDERYLAQLQVGRSFLDICRDESIGWRAGKFDTVFLGSVIGAAFSERMADRGNAAVPNFDAQATSISLSRFIARHRPYWPVLATPSSWPVFGKAALRIWKPVITHFGTLFRSNYTNTTAASADIPGLWSPRGVIDPAEFSIGRRSLGSQEKSFRTPADKTMSDLLWYVLSKSVVLPFFYQQGWPERAVKKHLEDTWQFLLRGKSMDNPQPQSTFTTKRIGSGID